MVRKPSTGEIIAKSVNQIVPLKFRLKVQTVVLYSPDPPFLSEGESGYKTKLSQEFLENTGSSPSDQNFACGLSWIKGPTCTRGKCYF